MNEDLGDPQESDSQASDSMLDDEAVMQALTGSGRRPSGHILDSTLSCEQRLDELQIISSQTSDSRARIPSEHTHESTSTVGDVTLDIAWPVWSEEQKAIIMDHFNYRLDLLAQIQGEIADITKCWEQGPMDEKDMTKKVKVPKSDLYAVICKYRTNRRRLNNPPTKGMPDDQFNNYLKGLIVENDDDAMNLNFEVPSKDLASLAKFLQTEYKKINRKANDLLNDHLLFGENIKGAKKTFRLKKKEWKVVGTWENWLVLNTGISSSYARQHIQVYGLVQLYPKLRKLNITYNRLFKIKNKIQKVLESEIGNEWK